MLKYIFSFLLLFCFATVFCQPNKRPSPEVLGTVKVQNDGKIIVTSNLDAARTFIKFDGDLVYRFNSDGTPDLNFGKEGIAYYKFTEDPGVQAGGNALTIQNDGKIVVSGSFVSHGQGFFCVSRFLSNGELDKSFGTEAPTYSAIKKEPFTAKRFAEGEAVYVFGRGIETMGGAANFCLAAAPDNKIVAAGWGICYDHPLAMDSRAVVVRFNADGSADNGFGKNGMSGWTPKPNDEIIPVFASQVSVQNDKKILLSNVVDTKSSVVVRLTATGALDNSFAMNGVLSVGKHPYYAYAPHCLQNDGKIVVAVYSKPDDDPAQREAITIKRYLPDGKADLSFGNKGQVVYYGKEDTNQPWYIYGPNNILLQKDGKIIVIGTASDENNTMATSVTRFSATGNMDKSFGDNGLSVINNCKKMANQTNWTIPLSADIQADGRIVVQTYSSDGNICLVRLSADGKIDPSFGTEGIVNVKSKPGW